MHNIEKHLIAYQARWIYVTAMTAVGLASKLVGGSNVNFSSVAMIALVSFVLLYNIAPRIAYKFYEGKVPASFFKYSSRAQFVLDILSVTAVIHFAGGIESISFIFYFFIIISAGFIYRKEEVYILVFLILLSYNALIYLEFFEVIPHAFRYDFSYELLYLTPAAVYINTLAVSLALFSGGFYVAHLSAMRERFERDAQKERNRRLSEIRDTDEIKSKFVTVLSHQFRTPLTHIKMALAELIEEKAQLSQAQNHLVDQSWSALERLIQLLERMMKMRELEESGHRMAFRPFTLNDTLNACIEDMSEYAVKQGVSIIQNSGDALPVHVKGSESLIRSAIETLIENGVDYSAPGGKVIVGMTGEGKKVRVFVSDQGINISRADRKKIFSKFYRTNEALRKQTDRTGLSLYLAKLIVKKHRGRIWFDSEGKCTTFYIELPRDVRPEIEPSKDQIT